MERKNGRLPIFTERFRELQGEKSNTEFADFLGISRQTVGFYCNGDRVPDALTLIKIAQKCEVSADWLLGISSTQYPDIRVQQICKLTGLSEELVVFLMERQGKLEQKVFEDGCPPTRITYQDHPSEVAYALNKFFSVDRLFRFSCMLDHFRLKAMWLKARAEFYQSELNDAMTNLDEYKLSYLRNECTEKYESDGGFRYQRFDAIETLTEMLDGFLEDEGIRAKFDSALNMMAETLKAVDEYIENQ